MKILQKKKRTEAAAQCKVFLSRIRNEYYSKSKINNNTIILIETKFRSELELQTMKWNSRATKQLYALH